MKIGIISDIHSNIIALKACITYMESVSCDEYLFLGDYISDTPYTRETMDYVYDFSFFDSLPITYQYKKTGCPSVTICHGSPASSRERLLVEGENTKNWLRDINTDYLICAHTHLPGELEYQGKHYFNCGSVGIAIGACGYAQCMIMEDVCINGQIAWNPTFLKIPYDNKQVVQDMRVSGLLSKAPWFVNSNIQILLTGADYSSQLVELANQLARDAGEQDFVDEKYWKEAAQRLGIPDYR